MPCGWFYLILGTKSLSELWALWPTHPIRSGVGDTLRRPGIWLCNTDQRERGGSALRLCGRWHLLLRGPQLLDLRTLTNTTTARREQAFHFPLFRNKTKSPTDAPVVCDIVHTCRTELVPFDPPHHLHPPPYITNRSRLHVGNRWAQVRVLREARLRKCPCYTISP